MEDLLSSIRKLQELYDDPDIVTTADRIKIPEPKEAVRDIELVNDFVKRNPRADGGRMGYSIGDRVDPIIPQNNLRDMTLEESTTGPDGYPMTAGLTTVMKVPSAIKAIESGAANVNKAKKIVTDFFKQRQPYTGATKIGESTTKDFTPEKNFLSVLKSYMNKYTGGSLSQASRDLGISRNTLKGIDERINLQEYFIDRQALVDNFQ